MDAMTYEGFVRGAFSLNKSTMINRSEDPARLAEAGLWNVNDLNRIKIGTAYALEAYSAEIKEILSSKDMDNSYETFSTDSENLLEMTLAASELTEILDIIERFQVYKSKYIKFAWQ